MNLAQAATRRTRHCVRERVPTWTDRWTDGAPRFAGPMARHASRDQWPATHRKGVASWHNACRAPDLPAMLCTDCRPPPQPPAATRLLQERAGAARGPPGPPCPTPPAVRTSTSMPMVMRDGNALGLIMTSGTIPRSLNGMSTAGHLTLSTPWTVGRNTPRCRRPALDPVGVARVSPLCVSSPPARALSAYLLPVARRKLVANHRVAGDPQLDRHPLQLLVARVRP